MIPRPLAAGRFILMIKKQQQGGVENISLNANDLLKINTTLNQVVWLFSYNNLSEIKISANNKLFEDSKLQEITLFVFTPGNKDSSINEIVISANRQANLFYGKVLID